LNITGFNMGLQGTPLHQYSGLLKEYLNYTKNSKVVVLAIDINGLGERNALYQGYAWVHHLGNENIYNALSTIDYEVAFKSRYIPMYYITTYDRRFIARSIKFSYLSKDGSNELSNFGFHPNDAVWEILDNKKYQKRFIVPINENIINQIKEILKIVMSKGMKVVVVVPPVYARAIDLVNNLTKFRKVLNQFVSTNVLVLDYTEHKMCKRRDYFANNTHLNKNGAQNFSALFGKDLKSWLSESYSIIGE